MLEGQISAGKEIDVQTFRTSGGGTVYRTVVGKLPDGKNVWASVEFVGCTPTMGILTLKKPAMVSRWENTGKNGTVYQNRKVSVSGYVQKSLPEFALDFSSVPVQGAESLSDIPGDAPMPD